MIDQGSPLKGRGFTVWTEGNDILIKYGVMYYGFLGTKRVPVSNITTINWKDSGSWTVGFLELNILGEAPPSPMASPNVQNQNRLSFERGEMDQFAALRDWIKNKMGKASAPTAGVASIADEIAKLAALLDQGVITQSEFDAQKTKLLSA
jgi:hypothetical protein